MDCELGSKISEGNSQSILYHYFYAALVDAVDLLSLDVLLPLSAGLFVLLALPSLAVFAVSVFPFSPDLVGSSLALAAALALSRWSVL